MRLWFYHHMCVYSLFVKLSSFFVFHCYQGLLPFYRLACDYTDLYWERDFGTALLLFLFDVFGIPLEFFFYIFHVFSDLSSSAWIQISHDMTKPRKWLCAQRRLWSAWASLCAQWILRTKGFFMPTAKTLIRLGGCQGWSEYSLGAQSFCWFCHFAAQIHPS